MDFSQYDLDEEINYIETNAIKSLLEVLTKFSPNKKWTVRELATFAGIGGMGPVVVGTPEQIVDKFEEWVDETDIDGFNIAYAITPGTFIDFADLVTPELQRRELLKTEYEEGVYREKLFGKGKAYLAQEHIGANYRKGSNEAKVI